MKMITETRNMGLNTSNPECTIADLKKLAGEFFDSASITYEWGEGVMLCWERPETQAEMDKRLAKAAKTKENTRLRLLEQVAAIERRLAHDQQKLENVKKTIANHYSDC